MRKVLATNIIRDNAEIFPVITYGTILGELAECGMDGVSESDMKELTDYAVTRGWISPHPVFLDAWTSNICKAPSPR